MRRKVYVSSVSFHFHLYLLNPGTHTHSTPTKIYNGVVLQEEQANQPQK